MSLMGFLDFVLKCIQLLAWPSFALGYPLCASIRAIETNSNFYMRKLVAYWIFFSLISLFEYTFSKLLEWVSVWPYVKILAVCWLAVPCFNGSSIAYNNIVRPCLSMQLHRNIVDMFNKKQYLSLTRESFLEEAERYIKENGTEALDKLLASKAIINEPPVAQKDINAVEIQDKSAADAENKAIINEPPVAQKDINAVESLDKSAADAENKAIINEPPVAQKDINAVESLDKSAADAENKAIINEPPVAQKDINAVEILDKSAADAENKDSSGHAMISGYSGRQKERAEKQQITTVDADIKVNNTTLPEKTTENAFPVPPVFKNVQKEWTCAVCQVTVQSEVTLNSHLRGIKHRTKVEELNAGNQTATKKGVSISGLNKETTWTSLQEGFIAGKQTANKNNSSSTTNKSGQPTNQDQKKVSSGNGINKVSCANQDPKKSSSGSGPNNKFGCDICQVKLQSEATLKSHLQGIKHKSKFEQLKAREATEKDKITSSTKYSDKNISGLNKILCAKAEVKIEANVSNGSHLCSICNVKCTSESDMASHLRGKRHLSEVEDSVHTRGVYYWCNICDVKCNSEINMASHLNGKTHDSNLYDSD